MAVLEVKDMKKNFGKASVLKGVSFSLEKGEVLAVIGSSGGGKTTLLRCINFLEFADGGTITVDGKIIYDAANKKKISEAEIRKNRLHFGLVFQQFNLLEEYNVKNNICMPLKLDGRKPDPRFYAEVLDTLGLKEKVKKYPSELSGGQQQRAAIARSVLSKPALIIADEPTGNLDKKTGDTVLELLTTCAARFGQTLIVVTHDPQIAKKADRIICIEDGRIVEKE